MSITQIRLNLGGESLYLYYLQRDLESFKALWLQTYSELDVKGKLNMLRKLHTEYKSYESAIVRCI